MPAVRRRKQTIKFRPKYAGQKAKEWSRRAVRLLFTLSVVGGVTGGAIAVRHAWSHNESFRIRDVVLQGDIPPALENNLPFSQESNLMALRTARVQREILAMYPELKSISVRRTWARSVVVTGHYRTPIAWSTRAGKTELIDDEGVVFSLPSDSVDLARLPELQWGSETDRATLLWCLARWAKKNATFSSQITKCETDTIHRLQVKLADGTVIEWGELDEASFDLRTKRVMRVLENYHPTKTPARLLFVTDDRLVMDANWASTKPL